ncbi:hypothetical protein [Inquilinus limosus]|uniref:hypothetical protein n=1 Tax=Inquilinus limosus TaxID=171674 RepID=UPI0012DD925F|nr:hypothetical protein [Inquilinus limosus]
MVEKSGETVVRADGKRMGRGNGPDLRIGRNHIDGPTEHGGAGALRRPCGFGRV